jgi:hypothetical protein
MAKTEKSVPKIKRSLTRSWEVVLGSYRPDGTRGNFSIHHSYDTKEKALKGWTDDGPPWVDRHPNFASLREVTTHSKRPFVIKEIKSLYSAGPFPPWHYGLAKVD